MSVSLSRVLVCVTLLGTGALRAAEQEKPDLIPYLGVATAPVDPMLARHLKLKPGTGLLVQMVDEKSAAQGVIEVEDILTGLDGQILVNPEQFVTLVRLQQPGQEIALVLRRAGAEKTVKVKLGERVAPDEEEAGTDDPWGQWLQWPRGWDDLRNRWPARPRRDGGELRLKKEPAAEAGISVHTTTVIERDGVRAELTQDGQGRRFKATDANGKVLYDGEITDESVEKMAPAARELYHEISDGTPVERRREPATPERGDPRTRVDT